MYSRLYLVVVLVVIINGENALSNTKPTEYWAESELFSQSNSPSPDLRLPSTVVPSFYRLKLITDLEKSNFSGEVYITIRASQKVKEIILHSKNLSINNNATLTEQIYEKVEMIHRSKRQVENVTIPETNVTVTEISPALNVTGTPIPPEITTVPALSDNSTVNSTTEASTTTLLPSTSDTVLNNVTSSASPVDTQITHSSVRNIQILSIEQASGDRLILKLATSLTPNVDYTLQLSFNGAISNSLTGFYKSTYTNSKNEVKKLGVTQFEPTSARAAFPCFDEPAFKAKFEISIAHPENITVLSNMKVATQEPMPTQNGWQWTHFERSVNMSTYLVAYILSDFKSLETNYVSQDNITKAIRVWTRPELIEKANYALKITPRLLKYYEEVFGVPYALEKIDLIAIPDFSSGAMENWGLITFRETTLLFDEKAGVPRDRQSVAIDVAHELAHQWFGNLVTMTWWTDLWLNEGFATYIEYVGVDHIEPGWNMLEALSRDKMDLLRSDALKNTSPVSRRVVDASEISQKFDEISYTKGANLIRMLNHTISEELFRKGLVHYLKKWQFKNAEENDLWQAMWEAGGAAGAAGAGGPSLVGFMNSWTRQAGYPVLSVRRDYDSGEVLFEQRLFSISKEPYKHMVDQLWQIPVSYAALGAPPANRSTRPQLWLTERAKRSALPVGKEQALYVNVDAVGYYRVNYDQRNWELLSQVMRSGALSAVPKAQLIDDAFNLAKAGLLHYSYALGLTTCVKDGEDSKIVWDLLLNNMGFLKHSLRATSGYVYFQDYMRILLKTQLGRLNYGLNKPVDDNAAFLAENLVMWECFVEAPRCLAWAQQQFDLWAQNPYAENPIPSHLRSLVYNIALKHGSRREFDIVWDVFMNSSDPNVKSMLINSLPATREEALITTLLEKSLSEIPKQYAVAVWSVEPPVGTLRAQAFLADHFQRVYDRFTAMDAFMFPTVLSGAFGFVSTEDELDKLKSFAMQHRQQLQPLWQTVQKLVDTATLRMHWMQRHADHITQWFKDYVTGKNETNASAPANVTNVEKNSANSTDVSANTTNVSANTTDVSANTTDVSANTTEVSANTSDVIANTTNPIPSSSATPETSVSSANATDSAVTEPAPAKASESESTTEASTSP